MRNCLQLLGSTKAVLETPARSLTSQTGETTGSTKWDSSQQPRLEHRLGEGTDQLEEEPVSKKDLLVSLSMRGWPP